MSEVSQERVIVGMSGGVDSAVAALLLCQQGYDVQGLFMANWEEDEEAYCSAAEDFQEARKVCEQLGIPLHRASFASEYREHVFAHFLREYARGRTPNPDVLCNREIKFGTFLTYARRLGAGLIATGHYARVRLVDGAWRLYKGADASKDQSYFLHAVSQEALASSLFPLGGLTKAEVRALARRHGLANHARKDSTGICFIGERPFRSFLARYLPAQPGEMRTPEGVAVGRHAGLMFYTLGQRHGLGLGGRPGCSDAPWYVVAKDIDRNVLVVAQGGDHPLLYSDSLSTGEFHWIARAPDSLPLSCAAKVRYRQSERACTVHPAGGGRYRVRFSRPQRAVTPGQYVVLYRDLECLGGGVIETTTPAASPARPPAVTRATDTTVA